MGDPIELDEDGFAVWMRANTRETSWRLYGLVIRQFKDFIKGKTFDSKEEAALKFVDHRRYNLNKPYNSVNTYLTVLKAYFNKYQGGGNKVIRIRKYQATRNEQEEMRNKELEKQIKVGDLLKLFNGAESIEQKLLLSLLLSTGARIGEIAMIRVGDFEKIGNVFVVRIQTEKRRDNKERYVPIGNEWAVKIIEEVIQNKKRKEKILPYTTNSMRLWLKQMAKNVNYKGPVNPHLFRHVFITTLMRQGMHMRQVQELAGHTNMNMTATYMHPSAEDLAANVIKIKDPFSEEE